MLGLAIVGTIAAVALLGLPLYVGLSVRASTEGAADASALAAADVAVGVAPGNPCNTARHVARGNSTRIERCEVDGLVVSVTASATFMGIPVEASATAGPPNAVTN
jgi:secretion/DNA translocation related TadE-like protein